MFAYMCVGSGGKEGGQRKPRGGEMGGEGKEKWRSGRRVERQLYSIANEHNVVTLLLV